MKSFEGLRDAIAAQQAATRGTNQLVARAIQSTSQNPDRIPVQRSHLPASVLRWRGEKPGPRTD